MSDLIERQDVLDIFRNLAFDHIFQCGEYCGEDERQLTIVNAEKAIDVIESLPSAESAHKKPISFEEQLSLDCGFCRQHECGDTLYELTDWDGGIGFDYIKDIRFCPICGRELYGYEDEERRENE